MALQARTLEKFKAVQAEIDGGKTLDQALKANKMGSATYYAAKKETKRKPYTKKSTPAFIDFQAPIASNRVAVIVCGADQLTDVLARLK